MNCMVGRSVRLAVVVLMVVGSATGAAAQNAPMLRYGFQAGRQYAYEVKIYADLDDEEETREGVLTYAVLSATDQQAVLKQTGNLAKQTKLKPGRTASPRGFPFPMGGPPFPMGGPPMMFGGPPGFAPAGPEGVTINRQGEMIVSRPLTSLPFLLGDVETLILEELPSQPQATWTKQRDILVTERSSSGPMGPMRFGPPGAAVPESQRGGMERSVYTVMGTTADSIRIGKKYELRTGAEGGGAARFDMTGSGELQFEPREGVFKALSIKYDIRVNAANLSLRVPVTVTYRLLTPSELAEHQKREADAKAKAAEAAAKAAAPQPFAPGERATLLKELRSRDALRMRAAADRLAKAPPDDDPAEVAKALAALIKNSDEYVQHAGVKALMVWATPEAEEALIQASQSENLWIRKDAIEALGKIESEQAAEAVAAQMYRNRGEAAKALKAMGPVAEAAAIGCLKDRDGWVRNETCQVLAEIGGQESLKALSAYADRLSDFEARPARNAIAAIEKRLGMAPSDAPAGKSARRGAGRVKPGQAPRRAGTDAAARAKPGQPQRRTWTDATGAFQIDATFVEYQDKDKKVTLKKADGSTLRVAIEKLSKEDQAYVEERSRAAPGKAANPFE